MSTTVYMVGFEELVFHLYNFSSEFLVYIIRNNRVGSFNLLKLMFTFKALLDEKVKNNTVSSHTKFKKNHKMASKNLVLKKNECENDYVEIFDLNDNYVNHPIEIDDDEVSDEEDFRSVNVDIQSKLKVDVYCCLSIFK